jgi:uncharacterized membrane protein YciS (DUF1049 family)
MFGDPESGFLLVFIFFFSLTLGGGNEKVCHFNTMCQFTSGQTTHFLCMKY